MNCANSCKMHVFYSHSKQTCIRSQGNPTTLLPPTSHLPQVFRVCYRVSRKIDFLIVCLFVQRTIDNWFEPKIDCQIDFAYGQIKLELESNLASQTFPCQPEAFLFPYYFGDLAQFWLCVSSRYGIFVTSNYCGGRRAYCIIANLRLNSYSVYFWSIPWKRACQFCKDYVKIYLCKPYFHIIIFNIKYATCYSLIMYYI